MFRLFRDLFTEWLTTHGTKPGLYQPGGMMGYPPLGWQISIGESMIVYRVAPEEPETLILILIEREKARRGLHSPFADLIRFLILIRRSGSGVTQVRGHINAVSWRPDDSLEGTQIRSFYLQHLGCHSFNDEQGTEWVQGSLETLEWLKAARKNMLKVEIFE